MDARTLFGVTLPTILARDPARARALGGVFVFELGGEGGGSWRLDLVSDPPSLRPGAGPAECTIQAAAEDFATMLEDPAQVIGLVREGRLRVLGDLELAGRLHVLFGEAAPGAPTAERPAPAPGPLTGVRVLDLSRLIPGPYCTLILAELGAEVIKVEDTGGGDYLRLIPPLREGMGGAYYALNRGKRSLSVDLKQPGGRAAFLRLLRGSRVVVESFRPGVLARLGLDYEALLEHQPQLILCSISGYGQDGPLAHRAGHDIDYLALSGALAAGGEAGGTPALPGVQVADLAGGALWATIRILAALLTPEPRRLDVSMTEGALALLLPWFGDLCFGGAPLRRGEATLNGGAANYGVYRAGDGGHLAVGSLEPKFWSGLCRTLGLPVDMAALVAPAARQRELRAELAACLESAPRDLWAEKLAAADVCCEPVLEMEEVALHPQHRARGVFRTLEDPARGTVSLPRLPLDGPFATGPAPRLGEHTDELLAAAGLSAEEIAALHATGAVR